MGQKKTLQLFDHEQEWLHARLSQIIRQEVRAPCATGQGAASQTKEAASAMLLIAWQRQPLFYVLCFIMNPLFYRVGLCARRVQALWACCSFLPRNLFSRMIRTKSVMNAEASTATTFSCVNAETKYPTQHDAAAVNAYGICVDT